MRWSTVPTDSSGRAGTAGAPAPKVETAWLSGRDLGRALVERLS